MHSSVVRQYLPALERRLSLPPPKWVLDAPGVGLHFLARGNPGTGLRRVQPAPGSPGAVHRRSALLSAHGSVHGLAGVDASRAQNARNSALRPDRFPSAGLPVALHLHFCSDALEADFAQSCVIPLARLRELSDREFGRCTWLWFLLSAHPGLLAQGLRPSF